VGYAITPARLLLTLSPISILFNKKETKSYNDPVSYSALCLTHDRETGGKIQICGRLIHHKVVSCAHIKAQYESQLSCFYEFSLYASLSPQNISALAFCGDPFSKSAAKVQQIFYICKRNGK